MRIVDICSIPKSNSNYITFLRNIFLDFRGYLISRHFQFPSEMYMRQINKNDLKEILKIYQTAFGNNAGISFRLYMILFHRICYVYEKNGCVLGYLNTFIRPYTMNGKKIIWMCESSLAVSPSSRGMGIAFLMLSENNKIAKLNNIYCIYADVREDNTASLSLFKKCGFQLKGPFPHHYKDGSSGYVVINLWDG